MPFWHAAARPVRPGPRAAPGRLGRTDPTRGQRSCRPRSGSPASACFQRDPRTVLAGELVNEFRTRDAPG